MPAPGSEPESDLTLNPPDPTLYRLKSPAFDELTAHVLALLSQATPANILVLKDVPLSDFVRSEGDASAAYRAGSTRLQFLLCDTRSMQPLCGIELKDGKAELDYIKL